LIAPGSRASIERVQAPIKAESFLLDAPEPRLFPARLPLPRALMDEHFSQEAFDHKLAALLIRPAGQLAASYQGDELGLHQPRSRRESGMQDPFGIRAIRLVWGRDGCRPTCPGRLRAIGPGSHGRRRPGCRLPREHRRMAGGAQEARPQHC